MFYVDYCQKQKKELRTIMELGAFSVSLAVKDIKASHEFYKKLGFKGFHGNISQNWIIMKNGDHTIGLFQSMQLYRIGS
jgi:predicted lactoylglutathione lyase